MYTMDELMAEIGAEIPKVANWTRAEVGAGAKGYTGQGLRWRFAVASFDAAPQGLPPGTVGYNGAATQVGAGTVLHLTRGLAEQACKAAEAHIGAEERGAE